MQAGLYANYGQGPVYLDALVGYAYSANQLARSIAISGLAAAHRDGPDRRQPGLRPGRGRLALRSRRAARSFVTPFARLQAYTGTQNAFTENGAQSLDLNVAAQTTNSLRTVLGAQVGGSVDLGWRGKLDGSSAWAGATNMPTTSRPVAASFVGAPAAPFTTYGASPQRDSAVIGIAANTAVAEATSLYLRYEGDISGPGHQPRPHRRRAHDVVRSA